MGGLREWLTCTTRPKCSLCGERTPPEEITEGLGVLICPGCVGVCNEILRDRSALSDAAVEAWLWR